MFDAQRLARKDGRRIHIDRLKEATLEEWISASEDLLGVADLERDTEHLKDISGLHLLGEAVNVGVDRGVVATMRWQIHLKVLHMVPYTSMAAPLTLWLTLLYLSTFLLEAICATRPLI